MRLTLDDINFNQRKALVRVDFNVPLNEKGEITNDFRIQSTLPTLRKILADGGSVICMSHLGRPKGKVSAEFSLRPVAQRLGELLAQSVKFATDCIGPETEKMAADLQPGEILLLENLRFHSEETDNDSEFSKKLAGLADIYVNDAFGSSHRAHASTEGAARCFDQAVSGYLMEKELFYLKDKLDTPDRPFTAILGGSKISGKIDTIEFLLGKVDTLILGGGMVYTFYRAMGYEIGTSLVEEEKIDLAKALLDRVKKENLNLIIPDDVVVASEFSNESPAETVSVTAMPADKMGLDIGPATRRKFDEIIRNSKTILWNGPLGVFEFPNFAAGTNAIAESLAAATEKGAISVIGGGDSVAAVKNAGLSDKMSHVSTGGGASLELISGMTLPGVAALSEKA